MGLPFCPPETCRYAWQLTKEQHHGMPSQCGTGSVQKLRGSRDDEGGMVVLLAPRELNWRCCSSSLALMISAEGEDSQLLSQELVLAGQQTT